MTAIVYVDGFNLYYGALKGTQYKWLDLPKLCRLLLPNENVVKVRYFTARVKSEPANPDVAARQDAYLRALGSCPDVSIHYGTFMRSTTRMRLANPPATGAQTVEVLKTEEKGSDVNLGSYVLLDAFRGDCDLAVMLGNDSDLVTPLRMVKEEFGTRIGLINPHPRDASRALQQIGVSFIKPVRKGVLASSQFPPKVRVGRGVVARPASW